MEKRYKDCMDIAEVLARRKPQRIAKRAMDIVLSAAALAVLWPLLLLIALAVVIDDPGPVFYAHRQGRQAVSHFQIPLDGDGRGQEGAGDYRRARQTHHPRRRDSAQDQAGRAGAASQRPRGADELRRPAPGGGAIRQALYAVSAAGAPGAPGHHGLRLDCLPKRKRSARRGERPRKDVHRADYAR